MRAILSSGAWLLLAAGLAYGQTAAAPAEAQPQEPAKAPRTHTVVKGDCLWNLSKTYYNNPFRWKVIYSANTAKIKDPHWIYPGQVFVIPDVPGPEIGEVGARPVETGAKIEAPPPAPEAPPVEQAQAPAPEPEPAAETPPAKAEEPVGRTDDLREKFPPGQVGQFPAMSRVVEARKWKEDGRITEFEGTEGTAAAGDWVHGKLKGVTAAAGDKFAVFRRDVAQIDDEDKKATYLQRVGTVQVNKPLGGTKYRFQILKSGDTVQPGDLLKKEAM
ncbi:MAG: LysM peptidoglycan-binding domain-containing protein [Elusimicrobia bacterium]|nr:LysM peptidoglycan-binding domain-containing protein [Elusimicrobiota bacterium]